MSLIHEQEPSRGSLRERILHVRDGKAVEAAAEARLRQSAYPEVRRVTCRFREGVLTLQGRVSSYYLKQIAQTLVFRVEGLVAIDNRLDVAPYPGRLRPERRWWHYPPDPDCKPC